VTSSQAEQARSNKCFKLTRLSAAPGPGCRIGVAGGADSCARCETDGLYGLKRSVGLKC
jgi:hypothetical protein